MTIGISKERLTEIAKQTHDSDDTNHIVLSLFDFLLGECKELDPWLPIDQNTPNDRTLWLYNDCGIYGKGHYSELFDKFVFLTDKYDPINATHWKELPPAPRAITARY